MKNCGQKYCVYTTGYVFDSQSKMVRTLPESLVTFLLDLPTRGAKQKALLDRIVLIDDFKWLDDEFIPAYRRGEVLEIPEDKLLEQSYVDKNTVDYRDGTNREKTKPTPHDNNSPNYNQVPKSTSRKHAKVMERIKDYHRSRKRR